MAIEHQPETEKPQYLVFDSDVAEDVKTSFLDLENQIQQDPALYTDSITMYSSDPKLVMQVVGLLRNHPDAAEKLEQWHALFEEGHDREVGFSKELETELSQDSAHSKLVSEVQNAKGDPEKVEAARLKVRISRIGKWVGRAAGASTPHEPAA